MLKSSQKDFIKRHIGPSEADQQKMLNELGFENLDDLIFLTNFDFFGIFTPNDVMYIVYKYLRGYRCLTPFTCVEYEILFELVIQVVLAIIGLLLLVELFVLLNDIFANVSILFLHSLGNLKLILGRQCLFPISQLLRFFRISYFQNLS